MDNIFNILSGFNIEHEKALMHGIYNAVALGILCLVFAASYGLYIILSPFVKPLIWALLCGAVLFPFKLSLTTMLQSWFTTIEGSRKPVIVNLLMVPLHVTDHFADTLGNFVWKWKWHHLKFFAAITVVGLTSSAFYSYSPGFLLTAIFKMFGVVNLVIAFFVATCNWMVVSAIIVGYLIVLFIYWTPENAVQFRYVSFVIWFIFSLYICNLFGIYPVATFCLIQCLLFIGFIYELVLVLDHCELNHTSLFNTIHYVLTKDDGPSSSSTQISKDKKLSELTVLKQASISEAEEASSSVDKDVPSTEAEATVAKPKPKLQKSMTYGENSDKWFTRRYSGTTDYIPANKRSVLLNRNFLRKIRSELRMTLDIEDDKVNASGYICGAMYLCIAMMLWKHKWLIPFLMVPIVYYLIKLAGSYFGLWEVIGKRYERVEETVSTWCATRSQALVPVNVQGLYKVGIIVNQKLTQILKSSIDTVSTIAVILGLLVFTSCASTFITFQVYGEGLHLLQVAGQLLNTTVMNNPDIDWIPQNWEDSINDVLDNAYTHGRDFISNGMKGLTKDFEPAKAEHLEKKVLELWDRLYQAWMMSADNPDMIGPSVDSNAAYSVWESIKDSFEKIPTNFFNITSIKTFVQENIGILTSILDSMWGIVKGNASVILSIFTESLYVIVMSGSLVFNFIISMVVFFSALFYLLSSSEKTYKPIELVTLYSPISCHRFAIALQEVVIGVFTVTFKLASFFGMWTWFVHNLFQVKVAYLPAVFATLLGAVPFLDPYFACLPATIELWLTRGPMTALLFFIFHFLASNIIVTDFYKEIKGGGHPYLTGLSIAGGTFCLGVEGAIFGPLLLCCIIVAINLGRRYLYSGPSEETLQSLTSQFQQFSPK